MHNPQGVLVSVSPPDENSQRRAVIDDGTGVAELIVQLDHACKVGESVVLKNFVIASMLRITNVLVNDLTVTISRDVCYGRRSVHSLCR